MLLDTLKKLSVWMLTCQVTSPDTEIFVCLDNVPKCSVFLCIETQKVFLHLLRTFPKHRKVVY